MAGRVYFMYYEALITLQCAEEGSDKCYVRTISGFCEYTPMIELGDWLWSSFQLYVSNFAILAKKIGYLCLCNSRPKSIGHLRDRSQIT